MIYEIMANRVNNSHSPQLTSKVKSSIILEWLNNHLPYKKIFCNFTEKNKYTDLTSRPCGSSSDYHSQIRSVHNNTQPLPRLTRDGEEKAFKPTDQNAKIFIYPDHLAHITIFKSCSMYRK